jgi:hypothetical protein
MERFKKGLSLYSLNKMVNYTSLKDKIVNYSRGLLAAGLMTVAGLYSTGCASFPVNNQKYIQVQTAGGVSRAIADPSERLDLSNVVKADKVVTELPSGKSFNIDQSKLFGSYTPTLNLANTNNASSNLVDKVLMGPDGTLGVPVTNLNNYAASKTNVVKTTSKKQPVKKLVPAAKVAKTNVQTNSPQYSVEQRLDILELKDKYENVKYGDDINFSQQLIPFDEMNETNWMYASKANFGTVIRTSTRNDDAPAQVVVTKQAKPAVFDAYAVDTNRAALLAFPIDPDSSSVMADLNGPSKDRNFLGLAATPWVMYRGSNDSKNRKGKVLPYWRETPLRTTGIFVLEAVLGYGLSQAFNSGGGSGKSNEQTSKPVTSSSGSKPADNGGDNGDGGETIPSGPQGGDGDGGPVGY